MDDIQQNSVSLLHSSFLGIFNLKVKISANESLLFQLLNSTHVYSHLDWAWQALQYWKVPVVLGIM